jgi:uncharacterized protein YbcI
MTDTHPISPARHRNATPGVDVLEHATDATRSNGHHPTTLRSAGGAAASAISNVVVAAFKRSCGKGPTKVKAYMLDDLVVVVARDTLTTLERTLVRGGHEHLVLEGRRALDDAVAEECGAAIEQATGQRVVGWQTQIDPSADLTVALVHLQPSPVTDLHR